MNQPKTLANDYRKALAHSQELLIEMLEMELGDPQFDRKLDTQIKRNDKILRDEATKCIK